MDGTTSRRLRPAPGRGRAERAAWLAALHTLSDSGVDFLVGGGIAMQHYLERWRAAKDLDVFIRQSSVQQALDVLAKARFDTEVTNPAWLAKAHRRSALVDLIFSSYNGLFPVDDSWFSNAREADVLGLTLRIVGPEEMIVSKSFVAARDRFDGSDIAWLVRRLGHTLDWRRIEALMSPEWEILLWQLVHYLYVFPAARSQVPASLVERLLRRMSSQLVGDDEDETPPLCRGTMLDKERYPEMGEPTGYEDALPAMHC